eukprot:scaffold70_cov262-Prasinococcus_capsulatus_cf.AAC.1
MPKQQVEHLLRKLKQRRVRRIATTLALVRHREQALLRGSSAGLLFGNFAVGLGAIERQRARRQRRQRSQLLQAKLWRGGLCVPVTTANRECLTSGGDFCGQLCRPPCAARWRTAVKEEVGLGVAVLMLDDGSLPLLLPPAAGTSLHTGGLCAVLGRLLGGSGVDTAAAVASSGIASAAAMTVSEEENARARRGTRGAGAPPRFLVVVARRQGSGAAGEEARAPTVRTF